ncbi:MAG: M15 family metallopeptidase [Bacteroidales bacterium]|jgi:D-alanyl-D-alanine carboxypeptidase|nr:M15 family metallopeptidase [Bacteroidales bacterium]
MKLILFLIALLMGLFSQQDETETKLAPEDYPPKVELLGQINASKHSDFVQIDPSISYFPEVYLRKQTYQAFLSMREAALKDGINLTIQSGTRDFYIQGYLWNQKFIGQRSTGAAYIDQNLSDSAKTAKVLEYSAMPGISRHHWGTDIDINSTKHAYFYSGEGKKVYDWLQENAEKYGFYQVYIPFGEDRKTGFNHEEWHWTYKPESDKFTKAFRHVVSYEDLTGFKGAEYARSFKVIDNYVYGINPVLLKD